MYFEANEGQTDSEVKFLSRGQGYTLFLTDTKAVLSLRKAVESEAGNKQPAPAAKLTGDDEASIQTATVHMQLIGANSHPVVTGLEELPGKANYFIGNDPKKWRTNVRTYAKVKYRDVYPGVDLVFYGKRRQLEYDFIVAPGGNPETITLLFEGAEKLELDDTGDLLLHSGGEQLRFQKPLIYQELDGIEQQIAGGYVVKEKHQVGFLLGAYDPAMPLVIDPVLTYSTYLGGNQDDEGRRIAVDALGNVYVTGRAQSSVGFPTVDPLQSKHAGRVDVFIAKLNPQGSAFVYSTYLGGSENENLLGGGISVDASGNAYVTGSTSSADFPTVGAFQPNLNGFADTFVAKLSPTGSTLVYSSYLGGASIEYGFGIVVDPSGNAYVTGGTGSTDFPTVNPLQPNFLGGGVFDSDAFVAKLNPLGSALVYSSYIGGSSDDLGIDIDVDASGNAYIVGGTSSDDFPTTNALQPAFGGGGNFGIDAFVAKLNTVGDALVYSSYLGGKADDLGLGIAVDVSGNAYVTGATSSADFPTVGAFQPTLGGGGAFGVDAFVTKLNPTGTGLARIDHRFGNEGDFGRPERFSESFAIDPVQVE